MPWHASFTAQKIVRCAVAVCACIALLGACGQTGPLFLPADTETPAGETADPQAPDTGDNRIDTPDSDDNDSR